MAEKYVTLLDTVHVVIQMPSGETMCQPSTVLAFFHDNSIFVPVLAQDGVYIRRMPHDDSIDAQPKTWHMPRTH